MVLEYLAKNHDVKYNFLEDLGMNSAGKEALGSIKIDEKIILISKSLIQNTPRWRFTLAHEIGHFLLHRNLDIPSFKRNHFDTDDVMNWEGEIKLNKNMMRLEWQANTFASSLLLPKNQVFEFVILKLQKMGVRNFQSGVIFLDEQWCNIQAYQNVLFSMKKEFNVSYQVINYRLAQLGILKNQSKLKRVNEIMKGSSIFEVNKL